MSTWTSDAETAMTSSPRYFVWWYTVKSVGLCVAVAALAFTLGKARRR